MINSEKENKKSGCRRSPLGDSLQPPCIFSYRIIPLLCLVYVVVYNESLSEWCYASQYHKSDNHHNLFSFPYINVVFSYLCPSFHLASCLATAYFMKFTLLLTSTASTTAKQQAATTNTIIIIVTLSSFLSNLIFSSPYWSSFFDCTAKVVPFVFAHKQKNNYFSFVITFIDIRQWIVT